MGVEEEKREEGIKQIESLNALRTDLNKSRIEVLRKRGFSSWFRYFEDEVGNDLIPNFSEDEGKLVAEKFTTAGINLKELRPTEPKNTTEGPLMDAINADLAAVFGSDVNDKVTTFVNSTLAPLRGKEVKDTKFLTMATQNLLRDIASVARMFQLSDDEMLKLHPEVEPFLMRRAALENLKVSALSRTLKGMARSARLTQDEMHEEHIWFLRGVRDLPPYGLEAIGNFVDSLLPNQIETPQSKL